MLLYQTNATDAEMYIWNGLKDGVTGKAYKLINVWATGFR